MRLCIIKCCIALSLVAMHALAMTSSAVKSITYQPQHQQLVHVLANTSVEIELPTDDKIESIQCGDAAAWQVTVNQVLPAIAFIKPVLLGSDTNLIVVGDQRSYFLHVISDSEPIRLVDYPSALQYRMPTNKSASQPWHRSIVNRAYSYYGPAALMPKSVFDNGKQTTLELRSDQPLPVVFAVVNRNGDESLVNSRYHMRRLVIEQVAAQFSLRYRDGRVTNVFNRKAIMAMHRQ